MYFTKKSDCPECPKPQTCPDCPTFDDQTSLANLIKSQLPTILVDPKVQEKLRQFYGNDDFSCKVNPDVAINNVALELLCEYGRDALPDLLDDENINVAIALAYAKACGGNDGGGGYGGGNGNLQSMRRG
jgi:hypothetical protein